MKKYFTYFLLWGLILPGMCLGQQPRKVTETFFPDPDVTMDIPVFAKKSGFTSHREMYDFLEMLAARYPSLIRLENVGQSQRGRDIPLVTVANGQGGDKLRMFYFARVHGDEPAGTEAMLFFIRQLAEDPEVGALLDRIDFYILPMVNPDGAESFSRMTANGIDLNRDQSKLDTPEAVVLHAVANRVEPHISIDYHEYQPVRSDFSKITSDIISTPWDIMFLYSGNPNVPEILRIDAVENLFIKNVADEMDRNGLTHHTYFTSRNSFGRIYMNVGGASPRSTSNAMALKNCVSLLMETRGIKLDRVSIKRRVWTAYLTAVDFARTASGNEQRVKDYLARAAADRGDIAVKFSAERTDMNFRFIDLIRNKLVDFELEARLSNRSSVTMSRPLPKAYYLLPSEETAAVKLGQMGIAVTRLENETVIDNAEVFTVTSRKDESEQVGGVYPVAVQTRVSIRPVTLPAGSYRVDIDQRFFRAATVLLEPESSNGFVNYRVIESGLGEQLPIFREI